LNAADFNSIVTTEQRGYLDDMHIPQGIAKNGALLENVFVVMVCILNKIPIFVVGKPGIKLRHNPCFQCAYFILFFLGCSKSLSMQLIYSNLRGQDSKSAFFQTLPQIFVIPYQGSESSTSDGILKVFDKANKYLEKNKVHFTPFSLISPLL
jgi:hypothetical protein